MRSWWAGDVVHDVENGGSCNCVAFSSTFNVIEIDLISIMTCHDEYNDDDEMRIDVMK